MSDIVVPPMKLSGLEPVSIGAVYSAEDGAEGLAPSATFVNIGERTNVTGSKAGQLHGGNNDIGHASHL